MVGEETGLSSELPEEPFPFLDGELAGLSSELPKEPFPVG